MHGELVGDSQRRVIVGVARNLGVGDALEVERVDHLAQSRYAARIPERILLPPEQRRPCQYPRHDLKRPPPGRTGEPPIFKSSHSTSIGLIVYYRVKTSQAVGWTPRSAAFPRAGLGATETTKLEAWSREPNGWTRRI